MGDSSSACSLSLFSLMMNDKGMSLMYAWSGSSGRIQNHDQCLWWSITPCAPIHWLTNKIDFWSIDSCTRFKVTIVSELMSQSTVFSKGIKEWVQGTNSFFFSILFSFFNEVFSSASIQCCTRLGRILSTVSDLFMYYHTTSRSE